MPCGSPRAVPVQGEPALLEQVGGGHRVRLLVAGGVVGIPGLAVGNEVVIVLPHRMVLGLAHALDDPGPVDGMGDALPDGGHVQRRAPDVELELEHARAQCRLGLEHRTKTRPAP